MRCESISRDDFIEFVTGARLAVLATVSESGRPEAALMEVAGSESGEMIFDTAVASRKLANLERNEKVAVVIGWQSGVSIQVEGTARIVVGEERTAYEQVYEEQWPASRVSDRSLAVIVVNPTWLCQYDATVAPARRLYGAWLSSRR